MQETFYAVVRHLPFEAADSLIHGLQGQASRAAARLSCSALRSFVDSNATSLDITVRATDQLRVEAGQGLPPSLARWPRCQVVSVTIDCPNGAGDGALLLALLPFMEPAGSGRRIETLRLGTTAGYLSATNGESLVCMLVQQLPNLRELHIQLPSCMSGDRHQLQLMYNALASLPNLERLTLPGGCSLDCVGTLAANTRLRHLCLEDADCDEPDEGYLSAAVMAGLAQLPWLEELVLPLCELGAAGSRLHALFRAGLPPSLQQLKVMTRIATYTAVLDLRLRDGKLRSAAVSDCMNPFYLEDLAALAQLLLGCPAMGPTLEQLTIQELDLEGEHLAHEDEAQVRALLQRCVQVRTGYVAVESSASAAEVRAVVGLLPVLKPDAVELHFNGGRGARSSGALHLSYCTPTSCPSAGLGAGGGSTSPPGGAALADEEEGGLGGTPLDPFLLLMLALRGMASAELSTCSGPRTAGSSSEGGAAAGCKGVPGGCLVLMQGPFVAAMVNSEPALTAWVRRLAAEVGAAAPGNDWGGKPVLSCQAVPLVDAVLVSCSSAGAAAAVADAARWHSETAGPRVLEVVQLPTAEHRTSVALFGYLQLVATAFWLDMLPGGRGSTRQEKLLCLLALQQEFNGLPDAVKL